jgi:hypothetical protein
LGTSAALVAPRVMDTETLVIRNIRGLNGHAHRVVVGELVQQEHCSIVGLQETKLTVFSDQLVCDMLGTGFDYSFSPGNWYSRGDRDSLPFSCLVGF